MKNKTIKDIEEKITVQCSKCGGTIGPAPILHNKRDRKDIADIYVEHMRKKHPDCWSKLKRNIQSEIIEKNWRTMRKFAPFHFAS